MGRLAVEATLGLASLVENLHHNIARGSAPLGTPEGKPMGGISGFVYRTIRGTTRVVGGGLEFLLGQFAALIAHEASSARREALVSALNGVLGDHLAQTGNPLAIRMQLRRDGQEIDLKALPRDLPVTPRVVLMIHGLCFNDLRWLRKGHDHGKALERDAPRERPLTVLYLNYNSGLHISTNGRELASLLEALDRAWPVDIEELSIVGHSMGGLVARSACAHGELAHQHWRKRLRRLVFLGTPHAGAPLERGGNWVNLVLDASPYTAAFARLARIRSAGITDLRHGSLLDSDWDGRDRFARERTHDPVPLPKGVDAFALAGSVARREGELKERMAGDGLVTLASALGRRAGPGGKPLFEPSRQVIARGVTHLGLLGSQRVYRVLGRWFA